MSGFGIEDTLATAAILGVSTMVGWVPLVLHLIDKRRRTA